MLIEFTVSNYRSFREPQTFSMAAAPRLRRKENTFKPDVAGETLPSLLKVAAIYGPNASGKSALLDAIGTVPMLMRRTPDAASPALPVWPFRYDKNLAGCPSEFEYHFVAEGLRYQFVVIVTSERVITETLFCFPRGKQQLLYSRNFRNDRYEYEFGPYLEGTSEVHKAWVSLTGPRTMFLSQAVANSSEALTQLRSPFIWFGALRSIGAARSSHWAKSTQKLANEHPRFAKEVTEFLSSFDIPIVGMRFKQDNADTSSSDHGASDDGVEQPKNVQTFLTHRSALGEAEFSFHEESDGTKGLMGFWLPWSTMTDKDSKFCSVLIVDEIDSSLHPKIVESLVRSHLERDTTIQLIFTTHDTHLMNAKVLRRDQFWLTERDENAATKLRSIHDFDGREGEDVEKRYYEGRYRALPILGRR